MSDSQDTSQNQSSTETIANKTDAEGFEAQAPHPRASNRSHAMVAGKMLALAVGMFGFGYAMVPIYDIICEVTGLNGKTGRVSIAEAEAEAAKVDPNRTVTVQFTSTINASGSWKFEPTVKEMVVKPGQTYQTSYYAENLTNATTVGQATPSVSPSEAAKYFNKTECFCFTQQLFEPLASKDMPLVFIIDADLPLTVDRVTLSYTFFNTPGAYPSAVDQSASLSPSLTRFTQEFSQ